MTRQQEDASGDSSGGKPDYDPAGYGHALAAEYDTLYPAQGLATDAAADFLATLAGSHPDRSILELGIGTGRLALELHRRGLLVAGIDASEEMVSVLRRKAPEAAIDVTIGDFVSTRVEREFSVVALVFNNILDPRGVSAQLAIFENAVRHMAPGGAFVVEAFVLGSEARNGNWTVVPRYVGQDHAELQMVRFDVETGMLERTLVHLRPEGARFISVRDAYAGPAELDVMAHVNGLTRVARYSTWSHAPFTSDSHQHISVYQRR